MQALQTIYLKSGKSFQKFTDINNAGDISDVIIASADLLEKGNEILVLRRTNLTSPVVIPVRNIDYIEVEKR